MSYRDPKIVSSDSSVTVTYGSTIDLTVAGSSSFKPQQSVKLTDDFFSYTAGTSVVFTINGTTVRTETATIPTAAIAPFVQITRSAGTIAASSVYIDLFYLTQTLTASR